jgi:hypothetical protein
VILDLPVLKAYKATLDPSARKDRRAIQDSLARKAFKVTLVRKDRKAYKAT